MLNFSDLSLIEPLLHNLKNLGFREPTPIQTEAIPVILEGLDLLGVAQTGTGKSAAFLLPLLQLLHLEGASKGVKALIVVPTRELALQLNEQLTLLGEGLGVRSLPVFGGVDQKDQVSALREGREIIIATPGRLIDFLKQRVIKFDALRMLILDEADRLLDMGFQEEINQILHAVPEKRQNLLFSATMPEAIIKLSKLFLRDPRLIEVSVNSSSAPSVDQKVIFCKKEDKFQLLRSLLKTEERDMVIVFTKTKESADRVKDYLRQHRLASAVIHGDKSQVERERALALFKTESIKILIATDIAARGLDIPGIGHVINFELPLDPETYVHRIGRTGRAGMKGMAISFCDDTERSILEKIQALIHMKIKAENFKGSPEARGSWSQERPLKKVTAPTPGRSQEKSAYLDHSKRQRVREEGAPKPRKHPGFKNKKK